MNQFKVEVTQTGGIAIIFENPKGAQQFLVPLLSQMTGNKALNEDKRKETTSMKDARARKRGTHRKQALDVGGITLRLAEPEKKRSKSKQTRADKLLSYEYDRALMTAEQIAQDDQRVEIGSLVKEFAKVYYGSEDGNTVSRAYQRLYPIFNVEYGYYPSRRTKLPHLKAYVGTRLNTLIVDGKGREFISFLNRQIRKLTTARQAI